MSWPEYFQNIVFHHVVLPVVDTRVHLHVVFALFSVFQPMCLSLSSAFWVKLIFFSLVKSCPNWNSNLFHVSLIFFFYGHLRDFFLLFIVLRKLHCGVNLIWRFHNSCCFVVGCGQPRSPSCPQSSGLLGSFSKRGNWLKSSQSKPIMTSPEFCDTAFTAGEDVLIRSISGYYHFWNIFIFTKKKFVILTVFSLIVQPDHKR